MSHWLPRCETLRFARRAPAEVTLEASRRGAWLNSKLVHAEITGTQSQDLDLDLGQCKVLRIETDDGFDGNTSDHMAFGDLRIVYYLRENQKIDKTCHKDTKALGN